MITKDIPDFIDFYRALIERYFSAFLVLPYELRATILAQLAVIVVLIVAAIKLLRSRRRCRKELANAKKDLESVKTNLEKERKWRIDILAYDDRHSSHKGEIDS